MKCSSGSENDKRKGLFSVLFMVVYMFFVLIIAVIAVVVAYIVKSFSGDIEETEESEDLEISFHPHAVARMQEREIDPERVMELLRGEGQQVKLAHYNRIKVTDGEVTAIVGKGLRKLEVVTVYWNDGDWEDMEEEM
jgi:hypothetical protein